MRQILGCYKKVEPEVEDLARRTVDNLDIDTPSPDDDAWCNWPLYSSLCNRILYFFLNEDWKDQDAQEGGWIGLILNFLSIIKSYG